MAPVQSKLETKGGQCNICKSGFLSSRQLGEHFRSLEHRENISSYHQALIYGDFIGKLK